MRDLSFVELITIKLNEILGVLLNLGEPRYALKPGNQLHSKISVEAVEDDGGFLQHA